MADVSLISQITDLAPWVFAVLIGACFLCALSWVNTDNPKKRHFVAIAPGVMTSLGILGTFLGIFLGLWDFDVDNITESVPSLLEGLKVAFITSILGLLAAVLFRIFSSAATRRQSGGEGATVGDIVSRLESLEEKIVETGKTNSEGLETLRNALTDDKDSSIVGQLQRLRTDVSDMEKTTRHGFEAQIAEFKAFAEHMSKAFSEAIIEELKSVIREFNEKISEQFGDNFKQLNVAVGRLVDWQEQYRQQMDDLRAAIENAVTGIERSRDALQSIEASAAKIPASIEQIQEANRLLDEQIETLVGHLGTFAEMRDKALNAFPAIEANIEQLTGNMRESAEKQAQSMQAMIEQGDVLVGDMRESSASVTSSFKELKSTTEETVTNLSAEIEAMAAGFNDKIKSAAETMNEQMAGAASEMSQSVDSAGKTIQSMVQDAMNEQKTAQVEMLDGLRSSFNETVSSASENMKNAISQLDAAMQEEIESVVRAMAENLSGISEKFVTDYGGLMNTMRQIVELGERARRDEQSTQSRP